MIQRGDCVFEMVCVEYGIFTRPTVKKISHFFSLHQILAAQMTLKPPMDPGDLLPLCCSPINIVSDWWRTWVSLLPCRIVSPSYLPFNIRLQFGGGGWIILFIHHISKLIVFSIPSHCGCAFPTMLPLDYNHIRRYSSICGSKKSLECFDSIQSFSEQTACSNKSKSIEAPGTRP